MGVTAENALLNASPTFGNAGLCLQERVQVFEDMPLDGGYLDAVPLGGWGRGVTQPDAALFGLGTEAATALRESVERYRRLVGTVPAMLYDYLPCPDDTIRFLYVSPRVRGILALEAEDLIADSMRFWERIHSEDVASLRAESLGAHREKRTLHAECRLMIPRCGVQVQWISLTAKPGPAVHGQETCWSGVLLDITARKEAERILEAHDRACRSLFEHLLNGVACCKMIYRDGLAEDFVYRAVNPSFVTQTGLQNVLGRRASEVTPGLCAQGSTLFAIFDRVLRTGQPERFEMQCVAVQQWISGTAYSPASEHFVVVFDVVTARKEAEARLHKLSLAVEQSPHSIVITNTDAEIEYVNETFTRITGYSLDELKGQNPRILQSGLTHLEHYLSLWEALCAGQSWQGEFINQRKNGEIFTEHEHFTPIRQPDGTVTHYLAIKEDITEKKRLGQELDRYRNQLEELVADRTEQLQESNRILQETFADLVDLYHNAPCGYHSLDEQGVYISVNDTELTMLGYTREELIGRKNIRDLMTKESQDRFSATANLLARTGRMRDAEYVFLCKDGSRLPVVLHTDVAYSANGNFLYTRSTLFDDTERKRREQQILLLNRHYWAELAHRADEAEAATRAKSAFLANMSHEIRTPMNAILGFTHLIHRSTDNPDHLDKLEKISTAANHLLSVINGILDLSKIESGRFQLEVSNFSFDTMLSKIVSMLGARLREKGLSLQIDRGDLPEWLYGDFTRLSQILLNYLDNAVKFTEQGIITLRARVLDISNSDLFVRFEVQDTGIGIEPDKCALIFSAFEQADSSIARRYGGTGLGLAINRRLVGLMGGETGVESMLGVGSTFWLTARLRQGIEQTKRESVSDPEQVLTQSYCGARILVVEDNAINREVVRELLEGVGLLVELTEDGASALEKIRQQEYDLILMDMHMPVMDGPSATRAIRALPNRRYVPILAMSANVFAEDRQQCLVAGMDDFVAKPVFPEALFSSLVQWLRHQEAATPPEYGKTEAELFRERLASQGRLGVRTIEGNLLISSSVSPPTSDAGSQPDPPSLPAALRVITGLDGAAGLRMQHGRLEHYLRLLHNFAHHHRDDMDRFAQNIAKGDRQGAQHIAHTLKGVAGNLGATDLRLRTQRLEEVLRSNGPLDVLEHLRTEVDQALHALVTGILAIPSASPLLVQTTPEQSTELLDQLEHLLATNDYAGYAFLRDNGHRLHTVVGEQVSALERLVERFDYESALTMLRATRKTL